MTAYRKDFDKTKYITFLIKDDELLEKYNEILENFKNIFKKIYHAPAYNAKYLKVLIKSYNGKVNKMFTKRKHQKQIIT